MKKTAVILVLLLTTMIFSAPENGNEKIDVKDPKVAEQLVSIVKTIIKGEDYSAFIKNISPEAYLINSKSYDNVFEVLSNSIKKSKLIEGEDTKIQFYSLRIPDNINGAYLMLETKSADDTKTNWHSVFFILNENQEWQILGWHKS